MLIRDNRVREAHLFSMLDPGDTFFLQDGKDLYIKCGLDDDITSSFNCLNLSTNTLDHAEDSYFVIPVRCELTIVDGGNTYMPPVTPDTPSAPLNMPPLPSKHVPIYGSSDYKYE